jgi:hypothetical protein
LYITSKERESRDLKWISLSYQWGYHQQLTLTTKNISQLCAAQPISVLPKTFRDTIYVARSLGVDYLWIDALCIIQNSVEDWNRESVSMRLVYANSYCTIAAGWAPDPTFGLFSERDVEVIRCGHVGTNWASQWPGLSNVRMYETGAWGTTLEESSLQKRGWALQERLLPSRTIHFTDSQILWECDSTRRCEIFPDVAPIGYIHVHGQPVRSARLYSCYEANDPFTLLSTSGTMSMDLFRAWTVLVSEYNRRKLTVSSDKLVALAGMAELFQEVSGDKYLAGLWHSRIWDSLLWSADHTEGVVMPAPAYRAPSWCFAALDGPIKWFLEDPLKDRYWDDPPRFCLYPYTLKDVRTERPNTSVQADYSFITIQGHAHVFIPTQNEPTWKGEHKS